MPENAKLQASTAFVSTMLFVVYLWLLMRWLLNRQSIVLVVLSTCTLSQH